MNIVFTSDLSGLGGGEVGIIYLVEELSKENECLVICRTEGSLSESLHRLGITTAIVDYKDKKHLIAALLSLRKILIDFQPDAVLSNDPTTSLLVHLSLARTKTPSFWIAHGQWYEFGRLKTCLLKRWNRRILCVSEAVARNLERQGFRNLQTTYLGVPTSSFESATPVGFRREIGIKGDTPLIVTVARFQRIKGQLKSIEMARMLRDAGDEFCYAFVGGSVFGSPEDLAYEQEVEQCAEREGLLGNEVIFVGERRDIPGIMREADLLVIPSDNESLGVVALEAIASQLPIISTPSDGVSEILQNDVRCIAKSNDAKGLYDLAHGFLNDSDIRDSILESYAEYGNRYRIEVVADAFIEAISR